MKNKKKVILGICSGIVLFVLTLMVYTVDTTEYVVVTQFGNPVRVIEDAGLQIKLPDPIQSVRRLDKRVQIYQADELELLSSDKKNVSLQSIRKIVRYIVKIQQSTDYSLKLWTRYCRM